MDDNIWEYPFGELDDDEEIFYDRPGLKSSRHTGCMLNLANPEKTRG